MQLHKIMSLGAVLTALFITPAKADWVSITVDVSDQLMYVQTESGYDDAYPISTGRKGYNTPYGEFKPYNMTRMHYSKKYDNAPMPNSIFFHGGYAIHATYDIQRLGRPASHGCVRLSLDHAKRLYEMVKNVGMSNTYIQIVP
jgi:lipoprotein-anchoring transpeptidase ErfK/SrfK